MNYAVTLPRSSASLSPPRGEGRGEGSAHDEIDLLTDLTGVEARWVSTEDKGTWDGWLPHPDLAVARELTRGSAEHEKLWARLSSRGISC